MGAGPPRGGGAYARSFPRLQTTPASHWPTRVPRRPEANRDGAPAPGRRSRGPHWRSGGKLRQRGCSCPPRAPGAARRLQRRSRGWVLPWLCPPPGGPGPEPRSGEPVGQELPTGDGARSHVCSSRPWQLPRPGGRAAAPDKAAWRGGGDAGSGTPGCSRAARRSAPFLPQFPRRRCAHPSPGSGGNGADQTEQRPEPSRAAAGSEPRAPAPGRVQPQRISRAPGCSGAG